MSKPETRFYTAVHKLLPRSIHREKMHNPFRGGTPDVWYSGNAGDLWVEYKWLAALPKQASVRADKLLSPIQQQWIAGRQKEGRAVIVILGTPEGAWLYEGDTWKAPLDPTLVRELGLTKRDVADYIKRRILETDDVLANPRHPDQQSDLSPSFDGDDDGCSDS